MKITSTLLLSFLAFYSSAQSRESILSSIFKTGIPRGSEKVKVHIFPNTNPLTGFVNHIERSSSEDQVRIYNNGKLEIDSLTPGNTCKIYDPSTKLTGKVTGLNIQSVNQGVFTEKRIALRCWRTLPTDTMPMLVVDGNIQKLETLSDINPCDIASVTVLKSATATAIYGPDGTNGAIVIKMKLKYKKFVIIDSIDKSPVARATTGITMKNGDNTMFYVADDQGVFLSNSPKEFDGLKMTISAVGYETATRYYNGDISAVDTIRLKRNIKTCAEVVISQTVCPRRIICCGSYRITRHMTRTEATPVTTAFHCYPNPVQRGGSISISFKKVEDNIRSVRLLSLSGAQMMQQRVQPGETVFQLQTDTRWSAGVYFVQLVYENGRVAASERIIIQ